MSFVIELGALSGRDLIDVFRRHDCKNVIFWHAGFENAPRRAYRKKADSPSRNPMLGLLAPAASAKAQTDRKPNAKRDRDGARRFPDSYCRPSLRRPDIDRSFSEVGSRSGRVSWFSKDWEKSVQTC